METANAFLLNLHLNTLQVIYLCTLRGVVGTGIYTGEVGIVISYEY